MAEELRRYETSAFGGQPGRWEQVAKLRPDMAATPVMGPTQTFEQALVLDGTDGRRVELLHPGLGHTRGDAVAWLPNERVLFTGDLASNGPFNIVRDSEMAPWVDTLATLQALDPIVVCPSHGARRPGAACRPARVPRGAACGGWRPRNRVSRWRMSLATWR